MLTLIDKIKLRLFGFLYEYGVHHETALWVLGSAFMVACSFMIGLHEPSMSLFSRSGSLVVVLGVVSSYRGLSRSIDQTFWKVEKRINELKNALETV